MGLAVGTSFFLLSINTAMIAIKIIAASKIPTIKPMVTGLIPVAGVATGGVGALVGEGVGDRVGEGVGGSGSSKSSMELLEF